MTPDLPPLTTDTIWAILTEELDDDTVLRLTWQALGYRYNAKTEAWQNEAVDPSWREVYPEPPDFIAYRPPTVKLTRSIPKANKQLLKTDLGFKGYKIGEFGPRQTRRATIASWLLSQMREQGLF
ncbi:MAG: DUF1823 family protein [Cyanobacteria bacterium P01_G01_bin.54]